MVRLDTYSGAGGGSVNGCNCCERERERSCKNKGSECALDSVGKDPNCWLKVGILSCQICKKILNELTFLGRHQHRWVVIQPERAIQGCREVIEDHLRARFVNFYGRWMH